MTEKRSVHMRNPNELSSYLKQNPQIKKWFKKNKKWFKAHPEALRSILEDPTIISSLKELSPPSAARPKKEFKLPPLSVINKRLHEASELLTNYSSLQKQMKKVVPPNETKKEPLNNVSEPEPEPDTKSEM
jgi:hypothetical protein